MPLELRANFSSDWVVSNKGSAVPSWYSASGATMDTLVANTANWWHGGNTDFFYSINGHDSYIQFGQDISVYASARFFSENIDFSNVVENADGSTSADVVLKIGHIAGRKTPSTIAGWSVVNTLTVHGTEVFRYTGNTMDSYGRDPSPTSVSMHVTVPPQSYSNDLILHWKSHYPNGDHSDLDADLGITLYNPTPPVYIPMSQRHSNKWHSLNPSGHILIRKSGAWKNKSQEQIPTSMHENSGHNRIRRSSKWLQLPKM